MSNVTELPGQDEIDFDESQPMQGMPPLPEEEYRTVLEAWKFMLDAQDTHRGKKLNSDWAVAIIAKWPFLRFNEVKRVSKYYEELMDQVKTIIDMIIEANPEALKVRSLSLDAQENKELYVYLLTEWQKIFINAQHEWDADDEDAAPKVVAIGEAYNALLNSQMGLAGYLGEINMVFTEEEQEAMNTELNEFRAELEASDE